MRWSDILLWTLVPLGDPLYRAPPDNVSYDSNISLRDLRAVARLLSDTFDSVNFFLRWYSVLDYEAQLQQRVDRLVSRSSITVMVCTSPETPLGTRTTR